MERGRKIALVALIACASGCSTSGSKVEVRPTSNFKSIGNASLAGHLSEAHSNLALGNVGLALELFRKAQREAPQSVDAAGGIADCYDRMGRYDLSRRYYEAALALAPTNAHLLNLFAASLDRRGERVEAAAVRAEIALRAREASIIDRSNPAPILADAVLVTAGKKPSDASVTVALPPARPLAELQTATDPLAAEHSEPKNVLETSADSRPRLERISLGEIALRTISRSFDSRYAGDQKNTAVRFVALKNYDVPTPGVRLLNAARSEGLAARTRTYLVERGWRRIAIGDANQVRTTSVIYFPKERRRTAEALAVQFNIRVGKEVGGEAIVMFLGRDATTRRFLG